MMIIYNSLEIGGVETFILRLAKERFSKGKKTKILLTSSFVDDSEELVLEISKYAEIYRLKDFVYLPKFLSLLTLRHFYLIYPMRWSKLAAIFNGISHVHVANSYDALVGMRIMRMIELTIPITIGVYHSKEFTWGLGTKLPFFEKINRFLFLQVLSKKNIVFFNDKLKLDYEKIHRKSFLISSCFPLGVVEGSPFKQKKYKKDILKNKKISIISIGRLVEFKSYNLWMLDVVNELRKKNIDVKYDVYGTGPLETMLHIRSKELQLDGCYELKGALEYSDFDTVVSEYDVFVGSGTAIVQAAGQGVPALIGIENTSKSETYGFFSQINGFSYNESGLYPTKPIIEYFIHFLCMDETDRSALSAQHVQKAIEFSIDKCEVNFQAMMDGAEITKQNTYMISWFKRMIYSFSLFIFCFAPRLFGRTAYDKSRDS